MIEFPFAKISRSHSIRLVFTQVLSINSPFLLDTTSVLILPGSKQSPGKSLSADKKHSSRKNLFVGIHDYGGIFFGYNIIIANSIAALEQTDIEPTALIFLQKACLADFLYLGEQCDMGHNFRLGVDHKYHLGLFGTKGLRGAYAKYKENKNRYKYFGLHQRFFYRS